MTQHLRLTKFIPGLSSALFNIAPKLLNFTTYPFTQGAVSRMETERELSLRYITQKEQIDDWHKCILSLLLPSNGWQDFLVRLGSPHDGGYAIPVSVSSSSNWVCIGLGDNWKFEADLVSKGNDVFSFDHTVVYRPKGMPSEIRWEKLGLGPTNTGKLRTIDSLLDAARIDLETQWCVKFDIEGGEWFVLKDFSASPNPPLVVTCELHDLLWVEDSEKRGRILGQLEEFLHLYEPVYVHGNNFSACFMTPEYTIYDALELTFIRKNAEEIVKRDVTLSNLVYPPNNPDIYNPQVHLKKES
jgi:hypothetical protein